MEKIEGVDLKKIVETAERAYAKMAEQRITDYVKGLKLQKHNLEMKRLRLINEYQDSIKLAEEKIKSLEAQLQSIDSGEWKAIDPLDLGEKNG